jgi:hypothetical protein
MLKLSRCFAANLWRESKPVSACFSQESDLVFLHREGLHPRIKIEVSGYCERFIAPRLRNDEAAIGCLAVAFN